MFYIYFSTLLYVINSTFKVLLAAGGSQASVGERAGLLEAPCVSEKASSLLLSGTGVHLEGGIAWDRTPAPARRQSREPAQQATAWSHTHRGPSSLTRGRGYRSSWEPCAQWVAVSQALFTGGFLTQHLHRPVWEQVVCSGSVIHSLKLLVPDASP